MINKFREDVMAAAEVVQDGATIAVGGFGSSGRPDALINAVCELGRKDLHVFVNNVGHDFTGVGRMVHEGRVRRVTCSFPILQDFYDDYFAGKVELELIPQGTLAERLRAGGAGIAAFYTPSGAETMLSDGTFPLSYADGQVASYVDPKPTALLNGRPHVLEQGIVADFALVRAHQADRRGNLRFRYSARNFNPMAAMSGRHTLVEVEQLVEVNALAPDDIHLPGVFVDDVVLTQRDVPDADEELTLEEISR